MDLSAERLLLKPSRRYGRMMRLLTAILFPAWIGLGVLRWMQPVEWWLVGTGLVLMLIVWVPQRAQLLIAPEGITFHDGWRTFTCRWNEMHQFRVVRMHHMIVVGFDFTPLYQRQRLLRAFCRTLAGVEAILPTYDAVSPHALAQELNARRERYRTR